MSFTKKVWKNKGETGYEDSKANATNLNDMEERIYQGCIVENGEGFLKFGDGTQICFGTIDLENVTFLQTSDGYYYEVESQAFAKPFLQISGVWFGTNNPSNQYYYAISFGNFGESLNETGILRLFRPSAVTNGKICVKWFALGRWKNS